MSKYCKSCRYWVKTKIKRDSYLFGRCALVFMEDEAIVTINDVKIIENEHICKLFREDFCCHNYEAENEDTIATLRRLTNERT